MAAGVLVYVAFSRRLDRAYVTAPMMFMALGAIVADDGLGLVKIELDGQDHLGALAVRGGSQHPILRSSQAELHRARVITGPIHAIK